MEEDYIRNYFNKVRCIKAICKSNTCWLRGDYPELELGKTYQVSHIGVLSSSTNLIIKDFPAKSFNASCFDLYENDESCHRYTDDPRFLAPCLRKEYTSEYIIEQTENKAIPSYLKSIEKEYNVKILLAVESGSRAWGFESQDSDWDVRCIYVHKPEWYFSVEEQRDVIEHMFDDNVDLVGWELRKALTLLRKSNPSLLEWLNSPKVYYVDSEFEKRIREVEQDYFNPVKSMYHYHRIYNRDNDRFIQHMDCHMKRFLYYLRGILACKWIETNQSIPPVRFQELLDATIADIIIKKKILSLIEIKKGGTESDMSVVDEDLLSYAHEWAEYYNQTVSSFRPEQHPRTSHALDSILFDMVNNNPK